MGGLSLDLDLPGVSQVVRTRGVKWIRDVRTHRLYHHKAEAADCGWVSMLSAPLIVADRLVGMIDVYTTRERRFTIWQREFFGIFANYAALAISAFASREQLHTLNDLMSALSAARTVDGVLEIFLKGALSLVRGTRGWISLLDLRNGALRIKRWAGDPPHRRTLQWGEGITGEAVRRGTPLNVGDVTAPEWKDIYCQFWPTHGRSSRFRSWCSMRRFVSAPRRSEAPKRSAC